MASMDIPYKPGVLEGVVYKDGAKISRSTLVTPKEAAVLELVPEEESFAADGKDLIYVRVTLKDADGNRLTQDEREIQVDLPSSGKRQSMHRRPDHRYQVSSVSRNRNCDPEEQRGRRDEDYGESGRRCGWKLCGRGKIRSKVCLIQA